MMSRDPEAAVDLGPEATGGPYFEDLEVGMTVDSAPALTITAGHGALHQAIIGDRLLLALDASLSARVLGTSTALAHPALVCDIAIGQSTLITQRVIANLFYRGLVLRRSPVVGDTLSTTTEVVALRQNRKRADRAATGLAALRIRTSDQMGRRVLDFWRCAMLPLSDPQVETGHCDDLDAIPDELDLEVLEAAVADWDLDEFRAAVQPPHGSALESGMQWHVEGGDVVSAAPELARLSLNVAIAHHDATAGADRRRLVYGGHTIGIAAAQATRALPNLVSVIAWEGCDHLEPVFEGDTLFSDLELSRIDELPGTGYLLHLRSLVRAVRDGESFDVLDWRFVAVAA